MTRSDFDHECTDDGEGTCQTCGVILVSCDRCGSRGYHLPGCPDHEEVIALRDYLTSEGFDATWTEDDTCLRRETWIDAERDVWWHFGHVGQAETRSLYVEASTAIRDVRRTLFG